MSGPAVAHRLMQPARTLVARFAERADLRRLDAFLHGPGGMGVWERGEAHIAEAIDQRGFLLIDDATDPDPRLAATAAIYTFPGPPPVHEFGSTAVAPAYQRAGLQGILLELRLALVAARGLDGQIVSLTRNPSSARNIARAGFALIPQTEALASEPFWHALLEDCSICPTQQEARAEGRLCCLDFFGRPAGDAAAAPFPRALKLPFLRDADAALTLGPPLADALQARAPSAG